jgi:signal transduction histidine kinase
LQGELTENTEKLESTNKEKDKFFSVLAHDLRGPLTAIMGMVDLMADKETKLGEKLMQEMASAMKVSVHSTNILLDNLLDWASLQRGLKAVHPKNTTYGELMALEMPTLIVQAANKNITIIDDIPEITPLKADPILVQSVFRNLITNAIKFTPTNGTIRLTSYISDDGRLIFSIVDSGIGMDNQLLKHIFEFGPRSQRPGTDGESSNGMGLMICKEFVEKHGGRIWVESVVNKGSTFSFCLEPVE